MRRLLAITLLIGVGIVLSLRGLDWLTRLGNAVGFGRKPVGPISKRFFKHDPMHASAYPIVLEKLALSPDDYYLDIACGGGKLLAAALEIVDHAAGLDHSSAAVEAARESYASEIADGRLDVREGDAGELPWEERTFDAVSIANAMHVIDDPRPVLREAFRVLKPGGRFVLITQAKEPIEGPLWAPLRRGMALYTDAELTDMLTNVGLTRVEAYATSDMGQLGYGIKV